MNVFKASVLLIDYLHIIHSIHFISWVLPSTANTPTTLIYNYSLDFISSLFIYLTYLYTTTEFFLREKKPALKWWGEDILKNQESFYL